MHPKKQILVVALVALSFISAARADLTLEWSENGGAVTIVALTIGSPAAPGGVTGATASFTTAHYSVQILAGNEQQTPTLSHLVTTNLSITKLDNSATTLNLFSIGSGFTAPVTPPNINVNSQIGGTVALTGPTDTLNFQSFVNGVSQGVQSPSVTSAQAFANSQNTLLASLSAPYTLSQRFDLFLASTNDQLGMHATTELSPVPEPNATALLLVSLLVLMPLAWRHRLA